MLDSSVISNNIQSNHRTFRVVITQDVDGVYMADIPSITHCSSSGNTLEEAMHNIREALEGTIETWLELGWELPDDANLLEYNITVPRTILEIA